MPIAAVLLGLTVIAIVLWDAFETVVLPRTIGRALRLTRLFYKILWRLWSAVAGRVPPGDRRQAWLCIFGPFSLLALFGLWSGLLIFGFAIVQAGLHLPMDLPHSSSQLLSDKKTGIDFFTYLYHSGVTFFTLGYGDVIPRSILGRAIAVAEAGLGFGLLAIVISYLPVIYQAFSRREVVPLLLDSRAGSPPTAGELLRRHAEAGATESLVPLLQKYELWSANLLESFISYPVLAYYRAQHERLAWLSALTMVLDTTALIQAGFENASDWPKSLRWQAQLTFALARHVLVDLAYLLHAPPAVSVPDRLSQESWQLMCEEMAKLDMPLCSNETAWEILKKSRSEYEPFVFGLAQFLFLEVPDWSPESAAPDSWQTSAWDRIEQTSHF